MFIHRSLLTLQSEGMLLVEFNAEHLSNSPACTERNVTQVLRSKMVWMGEISVLVTLKGYRPLRNTFGASKPG